MVERGNEGKPNNVFKMRRYQVFFGEGKLKAGNERLSEAVFYTGNLENPIYEWRGVGNPSR